METMNEVRIITPEAGEMRSDPKTGQVSGYALKFNTRSKLLMGQFYETIKPGALDGVLEKSDVLALLEHDRRRGILGRSTNGVGTLDLTVDDKGLRYAFTPPDTELGREVVQYLKRGDIKASSFHFELANGGDSWSRRSDGKLDRDILKYDEIKDVSLVFQPAYPETTATIRSLEEFKKSLEPGPQGPTLDEINEYYRDREEIIKNLKK